MALLHSYDSETGENADPEETLIPRLDAKEVAAVFTAPFHNFLRMTDEDDDSDRGRGEGGNEGDPGDWYRGAWTEWHQSTWRSKFHCLLFRVVSLVD